MICVPLLHATTLKWQCPLALFMQAALSRVSTLPQLRRERPPPCTARLRLRQGPCGCRLWPRGGGGGSCPHVPECSCSRPQGRDPSSSTCLFASELSHRRRVASCQGTPHGTRPPPLPLHTAGDPQPPSAFRLPRTAWRKWHLVLHARWCDYTILNSPGHNYHNLLSSVAACGHRPPRSRSRRPLGPGRC